MDAKKILAFGVLSGAVYVLYRQMTVVDSGITTQSGEGKNNFLQVAYGLGEEVLGVVMNNVNDGMSISLAGLAFIKGWEKYKKMPYYATDKEKRKGILTVGYGYTYKDNDLLKVEKFANGISEQQATELMLEHIAKDEAAIIRGVKVKLNQYQFDALVSKRYNTGQVGGTILNLLNNGNYAAAGNAFMEWVYQEGVFMDGLYKRRAAEVQIWFNGHYNSVH
jgi:lysozyme